MDIQRDIEKISSKATVADLIGENDAVFDDSEKAPSEELGKTLLSNMRRKSSGSLSLPSTPLQGPSIKEKRERFKRKRSRDPSMQKFLDDLQDLTSESGQGILKSTQSLSQDKSFEIEMPVLDYLSIVDTKDKETKKKMLERMHQKYPSVQEEHVQGMKSLKVLLTCNYWEHLHCINIFKIQISKLSPPFDLLFFLLQSIFFQELL